MKQLNTLLLSFVCVAMLFSSCNKEDDFDVTPVLEVEKSELRFTKDAGYETIGVSVNQEDAVQIVVSPSAREWLSVAVNEDKTAIEIRVTENTTNADRSGEVSVMIHKGNLSEQINVSQSGHLSVTLSKDNVRATALPQTGIEIYVEGNYSGNISVATVLDWIVIDRVDDARFVFDILENTDEETRSGEIVITVEDVEIPVSVWQDGIFKFQLPYLKIGYDYVNNRYANPNNIVEAFEFEAARGNTYTMGTGNLAHMFTTNSSIIPSLIYVTDQSTFDVRRVFYNPSEDLSLNEEYLSYMESENFELIYNDGTFMTMWNEELMIAFAYKIQTKQTGFHHSRYRPHHHADGQMFDLETFNEIPYPFIEFGKTLTDVKNWEAARGSTPLDKGPAVWTFTPNGEEHDPLERAYFIDENNKLTAVMVLFENIEYGMFPVTSSNAQLMEFLVTKEMEALLAADGFESYSFGSDMAGFVNKNKGIVLEVRVQGFDSEDRLPRLVLYIKPYVE